MVPEPNYHNYLDLSILEMSKTLFNHPVKPQYEEIGHLCYMHTNSFIVSIKIEHIYVEITKDIEKKLYFNF